MTSQQHLLGGDCRKLVRFLASRLPWQVVMRERGEGLKGPEGRDRSDHMREGRGTTNGQVLRNTEESWCSKSTSNNNNLGLHLSTNWFLFIV